MEEAGTVKFLTPEEKAKLRSVAEFAHGATNDPMAQNYWVNADGLMRAAMPPKVVLALLDEIDALMKEQDERDESNPCAQAIDDLWKAVILAHKPAYGTWEYPGQAFRHLLAEFEDLRAAMAALTRERDSLRADFERYAWHGETCNFIQDTKECTCGLDEARRRWS